MILRSVRLVHKPNTRFAPSVKKELLNQSGLSSVVIHRNITSNHSRAIEFSIRNDRDNAVGAHRAPHSFEVKLASPETKCLLQLRSNGLLEIKGANLLKKHEDENGWKDEQQHQSQKQPL